MLFLIEFSFVVIFEVEFVDGLALDQNMKNTLMNAKFK